jgi:hypothetical protein
MADASWAPEPLFAGATVFLLGGGPSLAAVDLGTIESQPAIAINSAAKAAPWAAVLLFRDFGWYCGHKPLVDGWAGLAITTSREAAHAVAKVRRVTTVHLKDFPPPGTRQIRYGRSSGHLAVSAAVAMAARRIVLLGYDCKFVPVDGELRSHWHDDYRTQNGLLYERDFLPAWAGWGAAAARAGVEIINATPESAITEFPFQPLDAILR